MSDTKERPIVLTAQEVNAVLAGDKTQHRIILSSQPYTNECGWQVLEIGSVRISDQCATTRPLDEAIKKRLPTTSAAPHRIGDRLWVQEEHRPIGWSFDDGDVKIQYQDGKDSRCEIQTWEEVELNPNDDYLIAICDELINRNVPLKEGTDFFDMEDESNLPHWRSADVMPKFASRALLEITDIRIERVRDIDAASAEVEGCFNFASYERLKPKPLSAFITYWMAKYGDDAWFTNPWVWVIEFKVIKNSEVTNHVK